MDFGTIRKILKNINIYKQLIILFVALIGTFAGAFVSIIYGLLVDNLSNNINYTLYIKYIIIYAILIICEKICCYIQNDLVINEGERVGLKYRKMIYDKACELDYIEKNKYGLSSIMTLYNSDIFQVTSFISRFVFDILLQVVNLAVIISIMFIINVKLTLIIISLIPIFLFAFIRLSNKIQKLAKDRQVVYTRLNLMLQENLRGDSFLQIPSAKKFRYKKIDDLFRNFYKTNYRYSKQSIYVNQLAGLIIGIANIFVLVVGSIMCFNGQMTIGNIVTFESYAVQLFSPLLAIISLNQVAQTAKPSLDRIYEFLEIPVYKSNFGIGEGKLKEIRSISVKKIFIKFDEKDILTNLSFNLLPNKINVIAGKSGCGKSTLCKIICGLIEPDSGEVMINDKNVSYYSLDSLRESIYYVEQTPHIYSGTLRENIELGEYFNGWDITQVLKSVNLTRIGNNSVRLDMNISEEGNSLSGGEKQKIALARALIRNYKIIILDEPTNGLDPLSVKVLMEKLVELSKHITIVMISHNVDCFKWADQIVTIEDEKC